MKLTFGILFLIVALIFISLAAVLVVSLGMGWLMTLLLPFSLFEATLLTSVALVVVIVLWYNILRPVLQGSFDADVDDLFFDEEDTGDYLQNPAIQPTRFYAGTADRNWESWVRFSLANSIYDEFTHAAQPVAPMGDRQQQELAIRLADAATNHLKAKRKNAKRLAVSEKALTKQLLRIGQQPYDAKILQLAVAGINFQLDAGYAEYIDIIRENLWQQPCRLFDSY